MRREGAARLFAGLLIETEGSGMTEEDVELLPLGSVVLLEEGETPLLVYGRLQMPVAGGELMDYVACPWPHGNMDDDHTYMFDHGSIAQVLFEGWRGPGEEVVQEIVSRVRSEGVDAVLAKAGLGAAAGDGASEKAGS